MMPFKLQSEVVVYWKKNTASKLDQAACHLFIQHWLLYTFLNPIEV